MYNARSYFAARYFAPRYFQEIATSTLSPATATLTFSAATPVLLNGPFLTPAAGSLVLSAASPSLTLTLGAPAAQALAFTGATPVLHNGPFVIRGATLTLGVFTPLMVVTLPIGQGTLTFSPSTPSLLNGQVLTPAAGALTLTAITPSVKLTLHPATAAALVFTGSTPTLTTENRIISPAAGTLVFAAATPILQSILRPAASTLTFTAGTLSIEHQLAPPATVALVFGVRTPSVTIQSTVVPSSGCLAIVLSSDAPTMLVTVSDDVSC